MEFEDDQFIKLIHLCMRYIGNNFHSIHNTRHVIPTSLKESLLEHFVSHDRLTEHNLPYVTYYFFSEHLKYINFHKCYQINNDLLRKLAGTSCRLRFLKIQECDNVTDAGILSITLNQDSLEILELIRMLKLTAEGLQGVRSRKLYKINLKGCNGVSALGIKSIVDYNPNIKILLLPYCGRMDDYFTENIASKLSELEELDLTKCHPINDLGLSQLSKTATNLKILNIGGSNRIGVDGFADMIHNCSNLQTLDLSYCPILREPEFCHYLLQLPLSLKELSFCGVQLSNEEDLVNVLIRLESLHILHLCGIPAVTDKVLYKILVKIGCQLSHLDLSFCNSAGFTDKGIRHIANYCSNLKDLDLTFVNQINGLDLIPYFQTPDIANNIQSLYLSCRQLSYDVIDVISVYCHNLKDMGLAGLHCVDDSILINFAKNCRSLNTLNLKNCQLVTDTGVIALAKSGAIQSLVLSGIHQLTDQCILALANHCPYLDELYIDGCSYISPWALNYLTDECIHRVHIRHLTPNSEPGQLFARNLDTGQYCRADII